MFNCQDLNLICVFYIYLHYSVWYVCIPIPERDETSHLHSIPFIYYVPKGNVVYARKNQSTRSTQHDKVVEE